MKRLGTVVLSCAILACSLFPFTNSYAANFPYNTTYTSGLSSLAPDQGAGNSRVLSEYNEWKSALVTSSGAGGFLRVQRGSSDGYDTVSEGIGYGMILSSYFNDQTTFDGLWKYAKLHMNSHGIMGWHFDSNGNVVGTGGKDGATDAEEDMAIALVFASKNWGSSSSINYEQDAKSLINAIYNYEVEQGSYVLKPGDTWGGSNVTNPSYFAPGYYRVFAEFTGNQDWIKVADKCYDILDKCRNSSTGLVPDWCNASGGQASGQGYDFKYDAIRTCWRIAVDYSWYGTSKAKTVCDAMSKFFSNGGIASIGDSYSISGNKISNNHSSTFIACISSGSMTGYDTTFAKNMYTESLNTKDAYSAGWCYFGNSLRMMTLLHTTGNFPNPLKAGSSTPTPTIKPTSTSTPTPTPTNQQNNYKYGDVNGDNIVDSADYTLLRSYLLGKVTSLPAQNWTITADVKKDGRIDSADYTILRKYLLKIISTLPQ